VLLYSLRMCAANLQLPNTAQLAGWILRHLDPLAIADGSPFALPVLTPPSYWQTVLFTYTTADGGGRVIEDGLLNMFFLLFLRLVVVCVDVIQSSVGLLPHGGIMYPTLQARISDRIPYLQYCHIPLSSP